MKISFDFSHVARLMICNYHRLNVRSFLQGSSARLVHPGEHAITKRDPLYTVHMSGFLSFRTTNLIIMFWISRQTLCFPKTAGMTKARLLQLKLIHIFARAISLIKKLEIKKTKSTLIISVLKVVNYVALISSIFKFFIN